MRDNSQRTLKICEAAADTKSVSTPPFQDRREIDRRPLPDGSDPETDLTARVLGAVQELLTRFANSVRSELQEIRTEAATTAATSQRVMEEQVRQIASAVERSQGSVTGMHQTIKSSVEERVAALVAQSQRRYDELDVRMGKLSDEIHMSLAAKVEEVARPMTQRALDQQEVSARRLDELNERLARFDQQAGSLVNHVNGVTNAIEQRMSAIEFGLTERMEERVIGLSGRVDEIQASVARQQSEVSNIIGRRVEDAEVRINERLEAAEARLGEDIGMKVANLDATLGRVSAGLDEAITSLAQRLNDVDATFIEIQERMDNLRQELSGIDNEAIEELKEKMSSVAGEAMLVRIEMERLEKSAEEKLDRLVVRINEIETTVQDQTMDVSTAVQLERLEELERAVMELDPRQFVRREELARAAQKKQQPLDPPEPMMAHTPGSMD
jgi:hypothetical protein